jgi:hypothetical protein
MVSSRSLTIVSRAGGWPRLNSEKKPLKFGDRTERFLVLFEKTSFADNDWRFLEWGKLPVCL